MASDKLRAAAAEQLEDLNQDMSSMIDLVFLLLIFFMVNSTLIVNRLDPEVKIPIGSKGTPPELAAGRIVINIYEDGRFFDDDENELSDEAAVTELVDRLRQEYKAQGIAPRVLIRADQGVPTKEVKRVVKAAGEAGVIDIIFAAYSKAP